MKKLLQFPLDDRGCLFYYCFKNSRRDQDDMRPYLFGHLPINSRNRSYTDHARWVDSAAFDDTMQILCTYEGKTVVQSEKSGFYYAIFPHDLCDALLHNNVHFGKIIGTWEYVRHGNCGIRIVKGRE